MRRDLFSFRFLMRMPLRGRLEDGISLYSLSSYARTALCAISETIGVTLEYGTCSEFVLWFEWVVRTEVSRTLAIYMGAGVPRAGDTFAFADSRFMEMHTKK